MSLRCCAWALSSCRRTTLPRSAWTSYRSGFSCCKAQAPRCMGFSSCGIQVQQWWLTGSRMQAQKLWHVGPHCSAACGVFPDQGLNPHPLHRQVDPIHCATREVQGGTLYIPIFIVRKPKGRELGSVLTHLPKGYSIKSCSTRIWTRSLILKHCTEKHRQNRQAWGLGGLWLTQQRKEITVMSKEYWEGFLESRRGLLGGFQVRQEILGAFIII